MKTIIAVIFFGILAYANASLATNKCSKDKAMDGFDPAKFFNGTWYVVEEMNETSPVACQEFKTKGVQGVTYFVESGYDKNKGKEKFQCDGEKKNDNQFFFKCKGNECGNENSDFNADFTVLDTDYVDYGLVSRCRFPSGTNEDDLLVIQRTKPDGFPDAKQICQNS